MNQTANAKSYQRGKQRLFSFAEYPEACFGDEGARSSCEAKHESTLAKQSRLRRNEPIQGSAEILRSLLRRGSFFIGLTLDLLVLLLFFSAA